jgi:hypothetical protein
VIESARDDRRFCTSAALLQLGVTASTPLVTPLAEPGSALRFARLARRGRAHTLWARRNAEPERYGGLAPYARGRVFDDRAHQAHDGIAHCASDAMGIRVRSSVVSPQYWLHPDDCAFSALS